MSTSSLLRLFALSAIWGASFLFMRMAVPVLGPVLLIACRVGLAALFLWGVTVAVRASFSVRGNARHYLMLGLFNSALPFTLFAHAAQTTTASLLSVLNATAPIWAALLGAIWQQSRLSLRTLAGLGLGVSGVAVLAGFEWTQAPGASLSALLAGLAAAASYGVASVYSKSAPQVSPLANAHGSMWAATLMLLPFAALGTSASPMASWSVPVSTAVLALGVVCSGVAYLLYFRLIQDEGASSALTVTFLIPVFGVLWGALILGEPVGWQTAVGGLAVLAGTGLVTGFLKPERWLGGARHAH